MIRVRSGSGEGSGSICGANRLSRVDHSRHNSPAIFYLFAIIKKIFYLCLLSTIQGSPYFLLIFLSLSYSFFSFLYFSILFSERRKSSLQQTQEGCFPNATTEGSSERSMPSERSVTSPDASTSRGRRASYNNNKIEVQKTLLLQSDKTYQPMKRENYFGLDARKKFDDLFRRSKNDAAVYASLDDLPDGRRTPRTMYLRSLAKSELIPLPLLIRKDGAPFDVSLAHRWLFCSD